MLKTNISLISKVKREKNKTKKKHGRFSNFLFNNGDVLFPSAHQFHPAQHQTF